MSEIHGSVGSYVTHALDPDELADFEHHLAGCETCRREVHEFEETTAELSTLVQVTPPPLLRASILSAIAEVRPLPPLVESEDEAEQRPASSVLTPDEHTSRESLATLNRSDDSASADAPAPTDELAARRARRLPRVFALVAAAALVIALGLGGWVVNLVQQQQTQSASETLSSQILNAPDATIKKATTKDGVEVSFVVSRSRNQAMFIGPTLGDPGPGKVFKLWTVKDAPVGDVTFAGGESTQVFMTGDIASASGLALSVETDPNATVPTLIQTIVEI